MNEFLYEGTVLVQARIGVDGHVQDAEVATLRPGRKPSYGDYPALQGRDIDEAIKKAIQSWVFEPAKCDGLPIVKNILIPFKAEVRGAGVTRLEF